MTSTDKIREYLKTWKEKREAATKVDGFTETNVMMSCDPESNLVYFLIGNPTETGAQDIAFIDHAANESLRLVEIAEELLNELVRVKKLDDSWANRGLSNGSRNSISEAIDRAAKKIENF